MKEPVFIAHNIVKKYGQTIALNNVDISIYQGEIRGFIGENGSGKSTMSALMTGIHEATGGSMYFHGQEWKPKSMIDALSNGIGIIVQENGTIANVSVAENMYLGELDNFSGANFFEEYRVENFSPLFKLEMEGFKRSFEQYYQSVKDLLSEGESRCYELKSELHFVKRDKLLENQTIKINELKVSLANAKLIKQEKKSELVKLRAKAKDELTEIYMNLASQLAKNSADLKNNEFSSFNASCLKYFDKLNDALAKEQGRYNEALTTQSDLQLQKRIHLNNIKEIKREYNVDLKRLNNQHFQTMEWIKKDRISLHNHYLNSLRKINEKNKQAFSVRIKTILLEIVFGLFVNRKKLNKYALRDLNKIGINNIMPQVPCVAYDMQSRKLVEIAKCLNKRPEIFIVDETTTSLSETGRNLLYDCMNQLKKDNRSVLFISHNLEELMEKCDTLTVLRDGSVVANLEKSKGEFDADIIKKHMIGRELKGDYYRSDYDGTYENSVVLKMVDGIVGRDLKHVNLELHRGEILGIGGLSECGMHTLGKTLFGNQRMEGGYVFTGEDLKTLVSSEVVAMKHNIGYLSKNRDAEALALKSSIFDNISIASINNLAKLNLFMFKGSEAKVVNKQIEDLSIKCNESYQLVNTLSGGNKQKVSLAKWIGNDSEILILDCPTRGVDIGVKQFIYQLMYKMKKEGHSILMISEELPELIGMSDRILIMKDGEIKKEFLRSPELSQEEIIKYMI